MSNKTAAQKQAAQQAAAAAEAARRARIKAEITRLGNLRQQALTNLNNCEVYRKQIEEIVATLVSCEIKTNNLFESYRRNYNVGGQIRDDGRIDTIKDKTIDIRNNLTNVVLPIIQRRINEINANITQFDNDITRLRNSL